MQSSCQHWGCQPGHPSVGRTAASDQSSELHRHPRLTYLFVLCPCLPHAPPLPLDSRPNGWLQMPAPAKRYKHITRSSVTRFLMQHFKCKPCDMVTRCCLWTCNKLPRRAHQPPCMVHTGCLSSWCCPACLPDEPPHLRHALEGDLCLGFMARLFARSDWQCLDAGGQLRRGLVCSCLARGCSWCLARRVLRPNACAGRVCAAHAFRHVA